MAYDRYKIQALKEDLKNAHDICCQMGEYLFENPETSMKERYFWALARGIYDALEYILKQLDE